MKRLRREIEEKIKVITDRIVRGQSDSFADYRENVGRLATLLEVREWLIDAANSAAGEDD